MGEESVKARPKMLFVDDRSKRLHYALDVHGKEFDVTLAPCVPEALRLLSAEEWSVVSLDHDLMGHDFEDPDTPTCGMEIVRYLKKCGGWPSYGRYSISGKETSFPFRSPPIFWIHSSNLFAAHLMIVALDSMDITAYYKPIKYPVENMKYDKDGNPT